MKNREKSFFAPSEFWRITILAVILVCGFATRLYDLADPPLEYAPSRQLRSLIIARGIYFENSDRLSDADREVAIRQKASQEMLEPRIMENLAALTYRIAGGEYFWLPRIFSALFWTLGGLFLYALSRQYVSDDGAVAALIYYLFVPFGLLASRTFQPDPLMTGLIVAAWWSVLRWIKNRDWAGALITGLLAGLAIFVKLPAVFFLFLGFAILLLTDLPFMRLIKDPMVWLIGILAAAPAVIYQVYGFFISGNLKGQLEGRLFNSSLWGEAGFYLDWLQASSKVAGHLAVLAVVLAALVLVQNKSLRRFLIATWIGYLIYGFAFSYYVTTHSYYLLPLIPLAAISLGAGVDRILKMLNFDRFKVPIWIGCSAVLLLGVAGGYFIYQSEDFRHEPGYYEKIAGFVSPADSILALSQDYGFRLAYFGGIVVHPWSKLEKMAPDDIDLDQVTYAEAFAASMENYDYFIITSMKEFRKQADLKKELTEQYPVLIEGEGYVIFSLQERGD